MKVRIVSTIITMTTTDHFRFWPDYFGSNKECLQAERNPKQTNPRYLHYNQTHFTAGDVNQFDTYRLCRHGSLVPPGAELAQIPLPDQINWPKYANLNALSVDKTFRYLFHKFKKGILIQIRHNTVQVFLPFSKKNFVNEWSDRIHIDPRYNDLYGFIKYLQSREGRKYHPKMVNKFIDTWYANNCLIRYEYPPHEGDTGVAIISDMFRTLCRERTVPDMDFFVNRRDFPLLTTNETEPYNHMFDGWTKLLSHCYDQYCPILSTVTGQMFADVPIPTGDDWARIGLTENKHFAYMTDRTFDLTVTPWHLRKSIAVFRGSSTGAGVTIETNPRLKVAYLSATTPPDSDGLPLLDAGITSWNLRPRKIEGEKYLRTIDVESLPFKLVSKLSPSQQTGYKYIINIDGHVSACRLSLELHTRSCILLVQSDYQLWYSHLLQPYVHYVPVKKDLSDLLDRIRWCKTHDQDCKQIGENAYAFAQTYLSKKGQLDYLQALLFRLKSNNGYYAYPSKYPQDWQEIYLAKILSPCATTYNLNIPGEEARCNGFLRFVAGVIGTDMTDRRPLNKTIDIVTENNYSYIIKTADRREAAIGLLGLNSLLTEIPNFAYTFGWKNNQILQEYIRGPTLYDYIHSDQFNITQFITILTQIALAISVGQRRCGLVHYDLTPWNIILSFYSPGPIDYIGSTIYRVESAVVPIIIDYNRSHIIHNNQHIGPWPNDNRIQDILTLLLTTLYEVSIKNLNASDVDQVIRLANFISRTSYRRKPFIRSGRNGLGDIRYFFGRRKKYSQLLEDDKGDLKNKTPLDFVRYVLKNFTLSGIKPVQKYEYNPMVGKSLYQYLGQSERIWANIEEEKDLTKLLLIHRARTELKMAGLSRKGLNRLIGQIELVPVTVYCPPFIPFTAETLVLPDKDELYARMTKLSLPELPDLATIEQVSLIYGLPDLIRGAEKDHWTIRNNYANIQSFLYYCSE